MHVFHAGDACSHGGSKSVKLLSLLGALMMVFAIASAGQAESARADTCSPNEGHWLCHWEAYLNPYQNRYFSASGGNNLRNWFKAGVGDAYGGSVAAKCVYIQRGSDGQAISVACGGGFPSNPTPTNYRPGYLFIMHWANGARTITGAGASP